MATTPEQIPDGWERITINVEPWLHHWAKQRAAAQRRSMSAYIVTLIEADYRSIPGKEGLGVIAEMKKDLPQVAPVVPPPVPKSKGK